MISYFDTPNSLTESDVYERCLQIYETTDGNDDDVLDFLSELASHVTSCPDQCDDWAVWYYEEIIKG